VCRAGGAPGQRGPGGRGGGGRDRGRRPASGISARPTNVPRLRVLRLPARVGPVRRDPNPAQAAGPGGGARAPARDALDAFAGGVTTRAGRWWGGRWGGFTR